MKPPSMSNLRAALAERAHQRSLHPQRPPRPLPTVTVTPLCHCLQCSRQSQPTCPGLMLPTCPGLALRFQRMPPLLPCSLQAQPGKALRGRESHACSHSARSPEALPTLNQEHSHRHHLQRREALRPSAALACCKASLIDLKPARSLWAGHAELTQ